MNATSDYAASTDYSATGSSAGHQGTRASTLCRPESGRMVAGVAAGVARSLGVDPMIIRIAIVVLSFVGGAGIPLYLAGWLLIPDEASGQSIVAGWLGSASSYRN